MSSFRAGYTFMEEKRMGRVDGLMSCTATDDIDVRLCELDSKLPDVQARVGDIFTFNRETLMQTHTAVLGHITPGNNYPQLIRKTWCNNA